MRSLGVLNSERVLFARRFTTLFPVRLRYNWHLLLNLWLLYIAWFTKRRNHTKLKLGFPPLWPKRHFHIFDLNVSLMFTKKVHVLWWYYIHRWNISYNPIFKLIHLFQPFFYVSLLNIPIRLMLILLDSFLGLFLQKNHFL